MKISRALLSLLLVSCAQTLPLEGAPCPCVEGWLCCPGAQVCAKDLASCPSVPAPKVTPSSATVSVTRRLTFSSDQKVTWSVEEAGGGTVDAAGKYTAPATPGTYHLKATREDGSSTARVELTVVPLTLQAIAGRYGGPSSVPIDGVGEDARFSQPTGGVFVDGYYYLIDHDSRADVGAASLRRVEVASGKVDTLFQGFFVAYPGTNLAPVLDGAFGTATMAGPSSVVSDGQGHLLVADVCLIRQVSLADLSVKTLWGDRNLPNCDQGFVFGLASDQANRIFYTLGNPFFGTGGAETVVRQLDVSTGADTLFAGQLGVSGLTDGPQGTFTNPGALAFFHGQFNPVLQVLDDNSQRLRTINLSSGEVSTQMGPVGSPFVAIAAPPVSYGGMVVEADGTLIPDDNKLQEYHSVLPVHPTGLAIALVDHPSPSRCFGTGECPAALFPAAEGTFEVFDLELQLLSNIAGRIGSPPDPRDGNGQSASFAFGSTAQALIAASGDDLFVWEPTRTLRKIDRANDVTTAWTVVDATAIAADADTVYVTDGQVIRRAPRTGGPFAVLAGSGAFAINDGVGTAASFAKIAGMALSPDGKLLVLDTSNGLTVVRQVDPGSGEVKTKSTLPQMQNGDALLFDFPLGGLTCAPDGTLYALSDHGVQSIDPASGTVKLLIPSPAMPGVSSIGYVSLAYDAGKLYLANLTTVDQYDLASGTLTTLAGKSGVGAVRPGPLGSALLHTAAGVAVLPNGDVAVVDVAERVVAEIK